MIIYLILLLGLILDRVHSTSGFIYCRKIKNLSCYLAILQQSCQMLKAVTVEEDGL